MLRSYFWKGNFRRQYGVHVNFFSTYNEIELDVEACARKHLTVDNKNSVKQLAMRVVRLLINAEELQDALTLIKLAHIIFLSPTQTHQLKDAVKRLSEIVKEFSVGTD